MTPVRRGTLALAALACAAATAGCGGDREVEIPAAPFPSVSPGDPDAADPTRGPAADATTPSPLPSMMASQVRATSLSRRVVDKVTIHKGPDWLAAGAGSVWVKTDSGSVVRVDPATTREVASIAASPGALCQGLGASDTAVWTCGDGGTVIRIDPARNEVAATVEVGKYGDQGQIPIAFGRAWVLTGDGSRLTPVGEDDRPQPTLELGTKCIDLTASATAIWAACPIDGVALRIEPATGQVTARIEGLTSSRAISAANGQVWVGFVGGVARIDEASLRVTAVADADPGLEAGIAATPEDLWARSGGDFLRRIDPVSGEVLERLTAPGSGGGEVLVAFGSVWATEYDADVLYRISPNP